MPLSGSSLRSNSGTGGGGGLQRPLFGAERRSSPLGPSGSPSSPRWSSLRPTASPGSEQRRSLLASMIGDHVDEVDEVKKEKEKKGYETKVTEEDKETIEEGISSSTAKK